MARLGFHQKVHLLVDFLLGMRLPETYRALSASGWTPETMDRGWRLVERAGRARFNDERIEPDRSYAELFAFKKRWFPVVRLALGRKEPELAARLIRSLDIPNHVVASFAIPIFLDNLDELEQSPDEGNRAARELLRSRGLTKEVTEAARHFAVQAHRVAPAQTPDSLIKDEARAEEELWDFYVEWSGLARRAIKNRNLLRCLGLNQAGRRPGSARGAGPSLPA